MLKILNNNKSLFRLLGGWFIYRSKEKLRHGAEFSLPVLT